jgi:hypothetical protein
MQLHIERLYMTRSANSLFWSSFKFLGTCSIALLGTGAIANPAFAMAINQRVTVQPIQVCNNAGSNCANQYQQLFAAETNKIWEQAGIEINFLAFRQFNNSSYTTIDNDNELYSLFDDPGHEANADNLVLSMWFVDAILPTPTSTTFGVAYYGGNRLAIGNDVFSYNNGLGRLDTIAHEIGHNLFLDHNNLGAGGANNLMTAGSARAIPGSINDIYPSGAGLDQLTTAQINQAKSSQYAQAVPTPSLAFGLVGLGGSLWRKRRSQKQLLEVQTPEMA